MSTALLNLLQRAEVSEWDLGHSQAMMAESLGLVRHPFSKLLQCLQAALPAAHSHLKSALCSSMPITQSSCLQ